MELEYAELNLLDENNDDPGIRRSIVVGKKIRLGRVEHADYADVAIKSAKFESMVSRRHATIEFDERFKFWKIVDEGSLNGVLVNGVQITPKTDHKINDGDVITFGTEQSDLVYSFEVNRRNPNGGIVDKELNQLEEYHKQGLITQENYNENKKALLGKHPSKWICFDRTPKRTEDVPGPSVSEFRNMDKETVIWYTYNFDNKIWQKALGFVQMDNTPFDKGAMRLCYHLQDKCKPDGPKSRFVAKKAKDQELTHTYFLDAEMQALCVFFAEQFNQKNPPKKVEFVEASIIEFIDRPGQPVYAVEPYLSGGKYKKHNNNYGFVSLEDRNTPQAFSHFTYSFSEGYYLVCDIQGISDRYTDPQVHSRDGKGFGKGNLGLKGIKKFFDSHECNSICVHLGIATCRRKKVDIGTKPPQNWPRSRGDTPTTTLPPFNGLPVNPYCVSDMELDRCMLTRQEFDFIVSKYSPLANANGLINRRNLLIFIKEMDANVSPHQLNLLRFDSSDSIAFRSFLAWWRGVDVDVQAEYMNVM